MSRGRSSSSQVAKPVELEEKVDLDGDNEEVMEEEVEYEEVEEEVEEGVEEEEELEEEEEVEDEEEVVYEKEEEAPVPNGIDEDAGSKGKDEMDHEEIKHAELLSFPRHGYEVYVGGIRKDVTEEDLKQLCSLIGELFEDYQRKDATENKSFAFMSFKTEELVDKVIEELSNSEYKARTLKVSSAQYYNAACAEYEQHKPNPKFKLNNSAPTVSWENQDNPTASARLILGNNFRQVFYIHNYEPMLHNLKSKNVCHETSMANPQFIEAILCSNCSHQHPVK
ncbi:hypothetical protein AMTRI_Chr11g96390 [Amborella trichopoda]